MDKSSTEDRHYTSVDTDVEAATFCPDVKEFAVRKEKARLTAEIARTKDEGERLIGEGLSSLACRRKIRLVYNFPFIAYSHARPFLSRHSSMSLDSNRHSRLLRHFCPQTNGTSTDYSACLRKRFSKNFSSFCVFSTGHIFSYTVIFSPPYTSNYLNGRRNTTYKGSTLFPFSFFSWYSYTGFVAHTLR